MDHSLLRLLIVQMVLLPLTRAVTLKELHRDKRRGEEWGRLVVVVGWLTMSPDLQSTAVAVYTHIHTSGTEKLGVHIICMQSQDSCCFVSISVQVCLCVLYIHPQWLADHQVNTV